MERMNVRDAMDMINEALHEAGGHAEFIQLQDMPESDVGNNAPQHLMTQTFDWRYVDAGITNIEKDEYNVRLTADDVCYLGRTIECYKTFLNGYYLKPALKRIIEKMGKTESEGK